MATQRQRRATQQVTVGPVRGKVVARGAPSGGRLAAMAIACLALVLVIATGQARMASVDAGAQTLADAAPDVASRVWLVKPGEAAWRYGTAGVAGSRALPDDEIALATGAGLVASTRATKAGTSHLLVRSTADGSLRLEVDLGFWAAGAAFTTDRVILSGYRDNTGASDGGIVSVALATGAITRLAPPRSFPTALGTPIGRGNVYVSPAGTLAATNLCGPTLCDTQVIDLASGELLWPMQAKEGFLRTLTDTTIIITDGNYKWIKALDARTGSQAWAQADSILMDPVAGTSSDVIGFVGSKAAGFGIAQISARGTARDLVPRSTSDSPWPHLWTQLSTGTTVVVGDADFLEAVLETGGGRASLLRVSDGNVLATDTFLAGMD